MPTSALFWNMLAKGYAKSPIADRDAYQHKLNVTRSYFTPESEVMEFGCGTGTTAVSHAPFVRRIVGYDVAANMLAIARARAIEAGATNVTFEKADIIDITLRDASFDAVMGHSILHLLKPGARKAVLAKVYRLLKPGGVFISSTVCLGEMKGWAMRILPPVMRALPLMPPVQRLSLDGLLGEIAGAGFTIEHDWKPETQPVLFAVARKPRAAA